MPAVAPILIGAAVSGLAAASWTVFGAAVLLGGLSYALTPKVKGPQNQKTSTTTSVRQSDLTRSIVYGITRVTKGYANIEVTEVNDKLHIVLILSEGELRYIGEIWMDDYCIPNDTIDADGNVLTGRYAGKLVVRKHLGAPEQVADPLLVANVPQWTTDHRLQGIAYLYLILEKDQDVYPNGVPNITAIVEGPALYDPRTGTSRWTTNIALYAYDYIRNGTYGFAATTDDVDDTNFAAQANICDEIVEVTDQPSYVLTVSAGADLFQVNDQELLPFEYGDRVRFTSTGTLPGGISAGVDYYVQPYQIRGEPRFAVATSLYNSFNKIYIDITSAGTGVVSVTKNGEPRYHGSGVLETDKDLSENLNNIVNCMAGRAICVAGYWTVLAGAWRTPAVDFTISDVRGNGIEIQNALSMSDSYNVIKGVFFSPLNYYQTSDYPSTFYQQFIDDDNGLESPKELNLEYTTRPTTAQRIAKIELFRGRQGIVVNADMSMKGMQVQCGDVISLTIDRYGWDEKPFEITEFTFANNNRALFTQMVLRETAQAIYDWDAGEAITYDPAPNSNLPNPFLVFAPQGVAYSSDQIETQAGDVVYALTLSWTLHPDSFVREFGDYEIQYKLSSSSDWLPSFFVDGSLTQTDVVNSSVNVFYDLRIRARNNLGVRSSWVTISNAVAGSSGGVGTTLDWGSVADTVSATIDWGNVADSPTTFNDWEYVS